MTDKPGRQEQHLRQMAQRSAEALGRDPAAPPSAWMPPPAAARAAVRMRWRWLDPQDVDDALQAFFLRTLEDGQRRVAPLAARGAPEEALGEQFLAVFRNALHRARSRRMTPALLDDPDHGATGLLARLQREQLSNLGPFDAEAFLGGPGGEDRLARTFEALWRLSPAQLVLLLELGLLGQVDTRAWTQELQRLDPRLTTNACAVRLSKAKAWALYRFCVLHFGLRERWLARAGDRAAAARDYGCFALAYLRGDVSGLKEATALARREMGVDDEGFRAGRDRVARWTLDELRQELGTERMAELEGGFRMLVLHLGDGA